MLECCCCFYVNRHSYKLSYARELSCQISAKYVVGSHVSHKTILRALTDINWFYFLNMVQKKRRRTVKK